MFDELFDSTPFMRRNCCGQWTPFMETEYRTGAMLSFVGYLAISILLLVFFIQFRKRFPKPLLIPAFCLVFLFCGLTHQFDWLAFVWPAYRLNAHVVLINGLLSVVGAFLLANTLKYISGQPTATEMMVIAEARDKAIADLVEQLKREQRLRDLLHSESESALRRLDRLEALSADQKWTQGLVDELKEIRASIHRVGGS